MLRQVRCVSGARVEHPRDGMLSRYIVRPAFTPSSAAPMLSNDAAIGSRAIATRLDLRLVLMTNFTQGPHQDRPSKGSDAERQNTFMIPSNSIWQPGYSKQLFTLIQCMVLAAALAIASVLFGSSTSAQNQAPAPPGTLVTIVTGSKFQQVVPPSKNGTERRSLTIRNNSANDDNCWVYIGTSTPSKETSFELAPGKSLIRYWPFVPSDSIQATCASSSDTLNVEYQ